MSTFEDKLKISIGSGALFALANYHGLFKHFGSTFYDNGCLTAKGVMLQTFVFFIITFLSMRDSSIDTLTKLSHTTYGTLIFFFVSNPSTYKVVGSLLGESFADSNGCPKKYGIILHTLLYIAILTGVMYFP